MGTLLDPPALSSRERGRVVGEALRWRVLHTRSRQEKAVAEALEAAGVEHYLPLVRRVRRYARSKRVVEAPLFPGYVFLHGTREDAFLVAGAGRVANIIDAPDQAALARELRHLRHALEVAGDLDPFPYLKEGRPVRVRSGPFKGVEGLVERYHPARRLVLRIQTLGQAASVEIDPGLLEPLD
jgi:transcription antitermination factor NusG